MKKIVAAAPTAPPHRPQNIELLSIIFLLLAIALALETASFFHFFKTSNNLPDSILPPTPAHLGDSQTPLKMSQSNIYKISYSDGSIYNGPIDNQDLPHGEGAFLLEDSTLISGKFNHGDPEGNVEVKYPNGASWQGPVTPEFQPNGKGIYTLPNGSTYVGTVKNFEWVGNVTVNYSSGNKYQGTLNRQFQMNGLGTFTHKNGGVLVGKFENGNCFWGTYTFENGAIYEGKIDPNTLKPPMASHPDAAGVERKGLVMSNGTLTLPKKHDQQD